MNYWVIPVAVAIGLFLYALYGLYTQVSIADIPGPESESFLFGNAYKLNENEVGMMEFELQDRFGGIARLKAPLGDDVLWLSDPKALQYILQTSGYRYPKQPERRLASRLVGDHGLTWAEGDVHKRQRKVMLPAFGGPEAKALLPIFSDHAAQVTSLWRDTLSTVEKGNCVIDVARPVARASLDAIGEAAFDYHFGNLQNANNELAKAYTSLLTDIFGAPSRTKAFFLNFSHYLPMSVTEYLQDHLPLKAYKKARMNKVVAHRVAHELIESKSEDLYTDKVNRDVMSILVRANAAEAGYARLSSDEMLSQMRTIMVAGQETTASTVSWALYELARKPEVQHRLRDEIYEKIQERGDTDFTVPDLEAMPYLQAVLREVMRLNPVVPHLFRMSAQDDIIPLSKPITTVSGKVIEQVPIRKGQRIIMSVPAYNRNPELWGEDAHLFNPNRFLDSISKSQLCL